LFGILKAEQLAEPNNGSVYCRSDAECLLEKLSRQKSFWQARSVSKVEDFFSEKQNSAEAIPVELVVRSSGWEII
jgi:hypothetical protein